MQKPLAMWITTNWNTLKEMGIPGHSTCLLRNLYVGQEATVGTSHGTTDWLTIGKGVWQGYILSTWLFNFYAEHIMQNTGPDESQTGIKIAGRNVNNLRYADDTSLMAESEEELKSILWQRKKRMTKLVWNSIQNMKIMAFSPITSWQVERGNSGSRTDFIFLGSKTTVNSDRSHEIKRHLILGRKAMTNLDSILKSRGIILLTKVH